MARSTFRRMLARAWRGLAVLVLALMLMGRPQEGPPVTDPPSQGEIHRAYPQVNWNS